MTFNKLYKKVLTIQDMMATKLDADIKTIEIESLSERFNFINNIVIPKDLELKTSYNIYTRENIEVKEYNILHDYVFSYATEDNKKDIVIAFSEIGNPLRDYYFI